MSGSLSDTLSAPFFTGTGGGVSTDVPDIFPIAINGRNFLLDMKPEFADDRWRHESLPLLRQQADQAQTPAETSLNPDGLWRRAGESWHRGAGQVYRDRDELGDPYRFRSSKGFDVWSCDELSHLPATEQKLASAETNTILVAAGTRLYCAAGSVLKYATSLTGSPFSNTVGSYTGGAILSMCTDGFTIYFTDGADLWTTNTGATTASVANTLNLGGVGYVKQRLMAFGTGGTKHTLYNLTTLADTTPDYTVTNPNTDFTWVAFAEGFGQIFAAGYSGDKSYIYRIAIKPDASQLDQPIVAGRLNDGEIVRSLSNYGENLMIGTDRGWHFAEVDGQGNLVIGVLVETPSAVMCFEPQDRFCWYGWNNYDSTNTGLGRADRTQFTGEPGSGQIAYASDLMVSGQGVVNSVVTFLNKRVFSISGLGVYCEITNRVATATIDSGIITFGLPDNKTAISVAVLTESLPGGSWDVEIDCGGDGFESHGAVTGTVGSRGTQVPFECTAEFFEVRLNSYRDGSTATLAPTILRWTLRAFPAPVDGTPLVIILPLLLYLDMDDELIIRDFVDLREAHEFLDDLRARRVICSLQEIDRAYSGRIEGIRWVPYKMNDDSGGSYRFPDATLVVNFMTLN